MSEISKRMIYIVSYDSGCWFVILISARFNNVFVCVVLGASLL